MAFGATWGEPLPASNLLVTVLPGSPELRSAVLDESGLLSRLRPGAVRLDLTSASPTLGAELASAASHYRLDYLETPVGGGPDAAESGDLTLYVGGEYGVFERIQPILRAFLASCTTPVRMAVAI
jgi:3-hydroxyisobutyrate dehydrogenase-like beta-hydroxyacid dehydrogenase